MKLADSKFKFETLLLRGLFVACMVVCGLFLTAMVSLKPSSVQLASHVQTSVAPTAASHV
jgi:hypothetical protein